MSGGHYDYEQYHLDRLAELMQSDLDRVGMVDVYGYPVEKPEAYSMDMSTQRAIKLAIVLLQATSQLVHDIDWCQSGDTGPDTLRRDVLAWCKTQVPRIRNARFKAFLAARIKK